MRRRAVQAGDDHPAGHAPARAPGPAEKSGSRPSGASLAEGVDHGRERDAPWLADGQVAARERQRPERAEPLEAAALDPEQLAAPGGPVGAEPGAVPGQGQGRALEPVLGHGGGGVGVVVLDLDRAARPGTPPARARSGWRGRAGGDRRRGARAGPTGTPPAAPPRPRRPRRSRGCRGRPRAGPSVASSPRPRQNAFLSCAPAASTGREKRRATRTGRGTNPRALRMTSGLPATTRATESSQREAMGRSWTRNRSAMPESRAERVGVLEGDRLLGEVPAGHDQRPPGVGQEQVVERRVGQEQAHPRALGRDLGAPAATPGGACTARWGARATRAAPPRPAEITARARAASRSRDHHGQRLLLAALSGPEGRRPPRPRWRRRPGGSRRAPSRPRRRRPAARPRPGRSRPGSGTAAAGSGPAARRAARRPGRRWAGRGSAGRAGSAYSRAQAGHIRKPDMVVAGRS